jgi:hypothetical protein
VCVLCDDRNGDFFPEDLQAAAACHCCLLWLPVSPHSLFILTIMQRATYASLASIGDIHVTVRL